MPNPEAIRQITTESEQKQFEDVLHYSFQADWARNLFPLSEGTLAWGAFSEDRATAGVIESTHHVYLFGEPAKMLGIGGVASLPEFRNGGSIRRLHEAILGTAADRGHVVSALYPFSFGFYAKFGYGTLGPTVMHEFAPEDIRYTRAAAGHAVREMDPAELAAGFDVAWAKEFTSRYDFANAQDRESIERVIRSSISSGIYIRAVVDASGTPVGVIAYRISEAVNYRRTFFLDSIAWRDAAAFQTLMAFVWAHRGQCATVKVSWPDAEFLPAALKEPRSSQTLSHKWMARPIDVCEVLSRRARQSGFSGELAFHLTDPCIPSNTGRYAVEGPNVAFAPGERTAETGELAFPVFSSLLFGALSPWAASTQAALPFELDAAEELFTPRQVFVQAEF